MYCTNSLTSEYLCREFSNTDEFIFTLQYINTVDYIKAYDYYTKIPSKYWYYN